MKWLIFGIVFFLPFKGYSTVDTTLYPYRVIDSITADSSSESFFAILHESKMDNLDFWVETKSIASIDSNGKIKILASLDTSVHSTKFFFLNDSIVLYELDLRRAEPNSLQDFYYNFKSHKTKIVQSCCLGTLSNDKHYAATGVYSAGIKSESWIYRLYPPDSISLIGKLDSCEITWPYRADQFLAKKYLNDRLGDKNHIGLIINPNLSIYDTITKNKPLQISEENILYNTNYHLTAGFINEEEYKREEEDYLKKTQGVDLPIPGPEGYWMIINNKSGKKKKIGFEEYGKPYISSSGRHILFYGYGKNIGEMKVISVKKLIEGM